MLRAQAYFHAHKIYPKRIFVKPQLFDRICHCTKEKYDHLWRKDHLSIFVLLFILRGRKREREIEERQ